MYSEKVNFQGLFFKCDNLCWNKYIIFVFQWKTKNFLAFWQHEDKKSNSFDNLSSFAKKHVKCKKCWNGDFQLLFWPSRFVSSFGQTYLYSTFISSWNSCAIWIIWHEQKTICFIHTVHFLEMSVIFIIFGMKPMFFHFDMIFLYRKKIYWTKSSYRNQNR